MSAVIVPFPLVRRRSFIARQAHSMAIRSDDPAMRYLQQQLRLQADTLARRGIAPDLVASEIHSLEWAIRVELGRQVLSSQGGDVA